MQEAPFRAGLDVFEAPGRHQERALNLVIDVRRADARPTECAGDEVQVLVDELTRACLPILRWWRPVRNARVSSETDRRRRRHGRVVARKNVVRRE
jgi:hypothetical protein